MRESDVQTSDTPTGGDETQGPAPAVSATEDTDISAVMTRAMNEVNDYVMNLLMRTVCQAARTHLLALVDAPAYKESKWTPFIQYEYNALGHEDALETEQLFLTTALWGELKPYVVVSDRDDP
ncbi:MAG: hypothetical protein R2932_14660 [Caldilineaceae bacterium]